jgi:hypothetical protein
MGHINIKNKNTIIDDLSYKLREHLQVSKKKKSRNTHLRETTPGSVVSLAKYAFMKNNSIMKHRVQEL